MLNVKIIGVEDLEKHKEKLKERNNELECIDKLALLQTEYINKTVIIADYYGVDRDKVAWVVGNSTRDILDSLNLESYEVPVEMFDRYLAEIEDLE